MSDEDPIPEGDAPDPRAVPRTVFAPSPGGRPAGRVGAPPAASGAMAALAASAARPGVNRLVDAAADLFDLVVYLRSQNTPVPIEPLREKAVAMVKRFHERASAANEDPMSVDVAHYAIAATIDDQVMSKPWAMESGWANRKVVDVLYGEVIGGEKFFDYLKNTVKRPSQFKSVNEFLYICLCLGFRGMYRRGDNRALAALDQHRNDAYRAVEQGRRGHFEEALSIRWQGLNTQRKKFSEFLPTWLMAALSAAAVAGLFVLFLMSVNDEVAESYARVTAMPPVDAAGARVPVTVRRLAIPTERQPVEVPVERIVEVREFLEEEIDEGLVDVYEDRGNVRILLRGEGMFASGEADVLPRYVNVLDRVAKALNEEPGDVVVEGHTDPIKPARTAKFNTNLKLSQARAQAVVTLMTPWLLAPERMTIQAYGEAYPLPDADNATPEGRARNRRVELLLIRSEDQDAQSTTGQETNQ